MKYWLSNCYRLVFTPATIFQEKARDLANYISDRMKGGTTNLIQNSFLSPLHDLLKVTTPRTSLSGKAPCTILSSCFTCHALLSVPLADEETAALLNHQVPGVRKQCRAPEPEDAGPQSRSASRNQPSQAARRAWAQPSQRSSTYVSDVCLKVLHSEGPNHEPELQRAKPPAQGDLPVLEERSTPPMVADKGSRTPELYHAA